MIYEFHLNKGDDATIIISLEDIPPALAKATLVAWIKELKPAYIIRIT